MTRSTRYTEAVRAFETWRLEQKAKPADLFTQESFTPEDSRDFWRAEALTAIERAARLRPELTVEDIDWSPMIDTDNNGRYFIPHSPHSLHSPDGERGEQSEGVER
jgi:hypothetical protein